MWTLHPPSCKEPKDKETWRLPFSLQTIWNQEITFYLVHQDVKHPHVGSSAPQSITREFHPAERGDAARTSYLFWFYWNPGGQEGNDHSCSNQDLDRACINLFYTHFQAWPSQHFRLLWKCPLSSSCRKAAALSGPATSIRVTACSNTIHTCIPAAIHPTQREHKSPATASACCKLHMFQYNSPSCKANKCPDLA